MVRVPALAAAMAVCFLAPQPGWAAARLAIPDIVSLQKSGLPVEAIKGRIQETGLAFEPGPEALGLLRDLGAAPDLVQFIADLKRGKARLSLADIVQLRKEGMAEEAIKGRVLEAGLALEPGSGTVPVLQAQGISLDLAEFLARLKPSVLPAPKAEAAPAEAADRAPVDPGRVVLQDLRPDSERASEAFGQFVLDPGYGIRRLGEDADPVGRVGLFRQKAAEALAGREAGPIELRLNHFVLYLNRAAAGRKAALPGAGALGRLVAPLIPGATAGPLPAAEPGGFQASANQEFLRGSYTRPENPDDSWIFLAYLDAELDGQRQFVRFPLAAARSEVPLETYAGEALAGAIAKFLAGYRP